MGLNDAYGQARGNILMMSPLPSMNFAYSFLLQDENQREVYANAQFNTDSGLLATRQRKQPSAQLMAEFSSFMETTQGKSPQRFRNQPPKPTISSQKFGNNDQTC